MTLKDHFALIRKDLTETLHGFAWGTRQTRQALKTALACVISVILMYFLDLKEAYWAGITTLIMMQPNVAASIRKGWMRAGGACCGVFLAIVLTGLFLQQHLTYTLAFFGLSVLGFYLAVTAKNGYFWSYFLMNGVLISMVGVTQPHITLYVAVHRGTAITLGVLVSLVVNVVLFPDYAHERLKENFLRHRKKTVQWIREILRQYLEGRDSPGPVAETYRELMGESQHMEALLQDAATEAKLIQGDAGSVTALFKGLTRPIADFFAFYEGLPRQDEGPPYPELHKKALTGLMAALDRLSECEGWSLDETGSAVQEIKQALSRLETYHEKGLSRKQKAAYGTIDLLTFRELIYLLRRVMDDLTFKTREDSVNEVAAISGGQSSFAHENTDLYRFLFLGRTRAIHVPSLKYAIKGALGIVCVFWFWFWAEIPGGALNMSVAVITVLQQDLMSTTHKGLLRFMGCLVGALTGYAFLGFQVESTWVLSVTVFVVVFCFAFVWGGKPGCAYLGCQGGLCFLVAAIHDVAPMTSLAPPTERLAGIFLGVLFTWTINLLIWREDLMARFAQGIRKAETDFAAMGEEMAARFRGNAIAKPATPDVAALESTLQTLSKQMELDPDGAIPVRAWLKQLRLLAQESAGMKVLDGESRETLDTLNPDFVPRLVETMFFLSLARTESDFQSLFSRLDEGEDAFKRIMEDLRRGVISPKPMDFKQHFSHTLVILKRLMYRMRALAHARRRFPEFLRGQGGD